jgi:hypothetical protein
MMNLGTSLRGKSKAHDTHAVDGAFVKRERFKPLGLVQRVAHQVIVAALADD